jgi:hypothetical protein
MTYCFDLDGTLCTHEENYSFAKPYMDRIIKVNSLFDEGNIILIDTARGSTTNIDWSEITKKQLDEWGVKYHKLRVGVKLNFDFLIDDKAITIENFFN